MTLINWPLARHPLNWLTIWLMLFLAGFALHLALQGLGFSPPKTSQPVAPPANPETNQVVPGNV